ncbi:hypothetical protein BJ912DRAFT_272186 [Pholiota molesta]|nr:hypothetical protein BJ912DRAFT_272186 [Pholiota molesta]
MSYMVPLPISTRPSSTQVYGPRCRVVWVAVARRLAEPKARHGRGARVLSYSSSLLCSCSMFWTPVVIPSLCCLDILLIGPQRFSVSARHPCFCKSSFPTSAINFAYVVHPSVLMTSPAYGWSTSMAPPRLMSRRCVPRDHSPTPSSRSILQYSTPIIYAEVRISKAL